MRQDIIRFEATNGEAEGEWATAKIHQFMGTVRVCLIGETESHVLSDGRLTGEVFENYKVSLLQFGFKRDGAVIWVTVREGETLNIDVKKYEDVLFVRYQVQPNIFAQILQTSSAHLYKI